MTTRRSFDLASHRPQLLAAFEGRVEEQASLARYTAARIGGPADALIKAASAQELAETVRRLWKLDIPFVILGGGSNMLVSDQGVRGVVLLNNARAIRFPDPSGEPRVWAESGASLGVIARLAAGKGLSGLEWAAGIPGTLGGAVAGNAGAHGSDISVNLIVADILHLKNVPDSPHGENTIEQWSSKELAFAYRSSWLKRYPGQAVVLSAWLQLERVSPEQAGTIHARMQAFKEHRQLTQPPGASMGSMFKNPSGDYAGRLIEAAGLKGARVGAAEISPLHANFFINHGGASASQVYTLIETARREVASQFGVELELEIELVGEWDG